MKTIPKIRGYVASQKKIVVFLYRRSNKITYLILLNYQTEKEWIEIGSRFYGRIYPNRCDLAPNGNYFLYFAMGKSQQQYQRKLYCWTGICIPPNLTAKLLFAHQDTWGGGGSFVDKNTIFISPGMYPDFDTQQNYQLDRYQITFEGKYNGGSWTSGKGWKLIETQINSTYQNPIPKCWIKNNGKITLIKYLNYNLFLKAKDGQTMGTYDLHSYEIKNNKSEIRYSLNDEKICLWADFDNYGRLLITRGSKIFIYQSFKDVIDRKPTKVFDLENLI